MNNLPKNIDELAVAANAEVDDEPARLAVTRLAVAALIGAAAVVLLAFMGSHWIGWSVEFFQSDCTASSGPFCGGFLRLWFGDEYPGH